MGSITIHVSEEELKLLDLLMPLYGETVDAVIESFIRDGIRRSLPRTVEILEAVKKLRKEGR